MLLAAITLFAGPACAADSTAPPAASGPAAAAASGEPQPAAKPQADGGSQAPDYKIDPLAQRIVGRACATLAESKVFTFHAEITFDEVLPSLAKLQFAAATDYAVRKPNDLAVDYESDLGAKRFWYNGGTLTIFDVPKMMYISTAVPSSIDAMLERVAERNNLTLPLADFALSDPCKHLRNLCGPWRRGGRRVRSPGLRRKQHRLADLDPAFGKGPAAQGRDQLSDDAGSAAVYCRDF
jgi:hypothetical protein